MIFVLYFFCRVDPCKNSVKSQHWSKWFKMLCCWWIQARKEKNEPITAILRVSEGVRWIGAGVEAGEVEAGHQSVSCLADLSLVFCSASSLLAAQARTGGERRGAGWCHHDHLGQFLEGRENKEQSNTNHCTDSINCSKQGYAVLSGYLLPSSPHTSHLPDSNWHFFTHKVREKMRNLKHGWVEGHRSA